MDVITVSDVQADLEGVLQRVVDDVMPIAIAREGAEAVVMVSISEWRGIEETLHLTRNPNSARRLREGIRELDAGRGIVREPIDA